jgi:predicted glycosyltransferase involved in capsule biosynthesis
MIISYCSQIKNRIHQLKQTIESNLQHIQNNKNTEWIIVDCDSNDGLYDYIKNFGPIERVRYYKTINYDYYSIPIAKNFASRLSSGDYVFNLDIDNYIGEATNQINELGINVGVCCNVLRKGIYGRIGCSKEIFNTVGGYDESFLPAGAHDTDLIARCRMINYEFKSIPCSIGAVLNSKEETAINMKIDMDWKTMNYLNGQKTKSNMKNKNYCPNKKFTSCEFEYNFNKIIKLSENIC